MNARDGSDTGAQELRPGGAPAWSAGATLLVLLAGIVVCRLAVLSSTWNHDTGAWMYISRVMLEGGRPYADVWDNKLPPLYWVGCFYWVTGAPRVAMFLTEVALTSLSALMLAGIVRRAGLARSWALVVGALFVCASMPAWEYAHRLETYALAPLATGLWLIARDVPERGPARPGSHVAAGALLALAVTFRAQHVFDAVLIGLWLPWGVGGREGVRRFAAYVGGGLGFTALFLGAVALGGYLPEMLRDAVLGSAGYASGGESAVEHSLGRLVWALRTNLDLLPLTLASAAGGAALALAAWRGMRAPVRALLVLAAMLLAAQFACTFVAGHQIIHYYFPLGWTAALLLGLGAAGSRVGLAAAPARAVWLPAAVAAVLFGAAALPVPTVYNGVHRLLRRPATTRAARLEQLVRENVPPDEPIYLLDDYALAGALARLPNPPATPRTILAMQAVFLDPADPPAGASPYGMTTLSWGRMIRAEMEQDPPPWLTRRTGIVDELSPWVEAHYDEVTSTDEFTVWRLRREPPR